MDKTHHLAELTPAYSHSTCASTKTPPPPPPPPPRGNGFLYDDYAREIPITAPPPPPPLPTQDWPRKPVKFKSPLCIAFCLALLIFVVQLGASLPDVPATQLLENLLCQQLQEEVEAAPQRNLTSTTALVMTPEDQCRGVEVQAELNVIAMGALILGYLPGLLVAIPYGMLSDRCGRKAVLGLSVAGVAASQLLWAVIAWNGRRWALRCTWASPAALLLGGGESVAHAMVFAMIADVAPQEMRATFFNLAMAAIMLGESFAPFVATGMMTYSLWLPLLAAPAIVAAGGLLIPILLPDTLAMKRWYHETHHTTTTTTTNKRFYPSSRFGWCSWPPGQQSPNANLNFDPSATPWSRVRDTAQDTLRLLRTGDVKLLLPCASLVVPVVTVGMNITLRYVPVRFGRTLAEAGMILGARTGLNVFVLVLLLPCLGSLLSSLSTTSSTTTSTTSTCKGEEQRRRRRRHLLLLARISIVLLVVGQTTFAAAPNVATAMAGLVVLTLGSGAPSLCRASLVSLAASPTSSASDDREGRRHPHRGSHPMGQLFGVLASCEALGYLTCTVGLGALYQASIHWAGLGAGSDVEDDGWLTLVFYVAAAVLFGCGGMLGVIVTDSGSDSDSDSAEDDDVDHHHQQQQQQREEEEEGSGAAGGVIFAIPVGGRNNSRDPANATRPPRRRATTTTTLTTLDDEEGEKKKELELHQARALADGRIVRKGPCLESIALAAA